MASQELLKKAPSGNRSTTIRKKADIQKELSNLDRTLTRYETRYGVLNLFRLLKGEFIFVGRYRNPKPIAQIEDELERAKRAHDEFVNSWYELSDLAQVCLFFSPFKK